MSIAFREKNPSKKPKAINACCLYSKFATTLVPAETVDAFQTAMAW